MIYPDPLYSPAIPHSACLAVCHRCFAHSFRQIMSRSSDEKRPNSFPMMFGTPSITDESSLIHHRTRCFRCPRLAPPHAEPDHILSQSVQVAVPPLQFCMNISIISLSTRLSTFLLSFATCLFSPEKPLISLSLLP